MRSPNAQMRLTPGRCLRSTALGLAAFVAGACRSPGAARLAPAPQPPLSDPTAVFSAARAREEAVNTLRARFKASTRRQEETQTTDGVLLVRKPDRFRLRLMLPFGLTVFDYVSWGDRAQMSLPLQGLVTTTPDGEGPLAFSQEDFRQAFLRGAYAFPAECNASSGVVGESVVVCRDAAGTVLRRIDLDDATATIRDETSYQGGAPRVLFRYADYRPAGDTLLPYDIALVYPDQQLSLAIAIERYEVNVALDDALFQPPERRAHS